MNAERAIPCFKCVEHYVIGIGDSVKQSAFTALTYIKIATEEREKYGIITEIF